MNTKRIAYINREVYKVGYSRALTAFSQAGHTRVSPSENERRDYAYAWREFIAGWEDAKQEYMKS